MHCQAETGAAHTGSVRFDALRGALRTCGGNARRQTSHGMRAGNPTALHLACCYDVSSMCLYCLGSPLLRLLLGLISTSRSATVLREVGIRASVRNIAIHKSITKSQVTRGKLTAEVWPPRR